MQRHLLRAAMVVAIVFIAGHVRAEIVTVGDVTPDPPADGGAVTGPFLVGDTGTGSVIATLGKAFTNTGAATLGTAVTGVGIVNLAGPGSNWTFITDGGDLTVGSAGTGTINISDQARLTVDDDSILGALSAGAGRVVVTGAGSFWENGDDLTIGQNGVGVIELRDGGQLNSDTSVLGGNAAGEGVVTVSGSFSRWAATAPITVGNNGHGTLRVLNGGRVVQESGSSIGNSAGAVGVVEVNGPGSFWDAGSALQVGNGGTGTLQVTSGGRVSSGGAVNIATETTAQGSVLVRGINSRWTIDSALTTGLGEASITLADGGVLVTTTASVISPTGRLTLNGGRWESNAGGAGVITAHGLIEGGGTLDVGSVALSASGAVRGRIQTKAGDHLLITGILTNAGNIDLDGGELEVRGALANNLDIDLRNGAALRTGSTGLDNNSGAQLAITAGSVDVFGPVDNNAAAEIAVVGGATAVFHDPLINNGKIFVAPGSDLVLLDDLDFDSGSLSVGLAATVRGENPADAFGRVTTTGSASLTGTLIVSSAAGFAPALGESFEILRADDGRTGTFNNESLPDLAGNMAFDVVYSANAVTLAVVPGLAGDYNANGAVDGADFTIWRDSLNRSGPALAADGNRDGTVNTADFNLWKSNFGDTAGAGSVASNQVPEPNAWLLAIAAASAFCIARR